MGFPAKLKDMNLYGDGVSWKGQIAELTLPKLALKMQDFRGGGMIGDVSIGMGLEKIEFEFKAGGLLLEPLGSFGSPLVDAAQLRFAGAYQDDSAGTVHVADVTARGQYSEVDFGNQKMGDDTETTYKMACSYYKLVWDEEIVIEIDLVNSVFIVFGADRWAEIRDAIGT